jgi:hypothetical protein
MERINLNIPLPARRELKRVAKAWGRTESEVARQLVLQGLAQIEKNQFYARVAAAQTPALRKRHLAIHTAMEKLNGAAR